MFKKRRPLSKEDQNYFRLELVYLQTACKRLNIFPFYLHQRHSVDTQMAGPLQIQPRERMLALQGLKRSWNGSCSLVLAVSSSIWVLGPRKEPSLETLALHEQCFLIVNISNRYLDSSLVKKRQVNAFFLFVCQHVQS